MARGWLHTNQAYADAEYRLRRLRRSVLHAIYAEWWAWDGNTDFDKKVYDLARRQARSLPAAILCDIIWEKASELRICASGEFSLWMCPYGCSSHQVSPDALMESEYDEKETA